MKLVSSATSEYKILPYILIADRVQADYSLIDNFSFWLKALPWRLEFFSGRAYYITRNFIRECIEHMTSSQVPDGFHYVGNLIRPPSEAYSILIQATMGCSHNKCTFCGTYKNKRFGIKPEEILLQDLAFARKYCRRQDRAGQACSDI